MSDVAGGDWFVSGAHARRALGHLSVALVEAEALPGDFELPRLLDMWGEALEVTMEPGEFSPVDGDQVIAGIRATQGEIADFAPYVTIVATLAIYGKEANIDALIEKARGLNEAAGVRTNGGSDE